MAFGDTVKNICLLTTKQGKFEKRRDDGSRRGYGTNKQLKGFSSARNSMEEEDIMGYTDGFLLSSRSGHPNLHIKERFNQHTKNSTQLGGTNNSWYTPITHTATSKKISTG